MTGWASAQRWTIRPRPPVSSQPCSSPKRCPPSLAAAPSMGSLSSRPGWLAVRAELGEPVGKSDLEHVALQGGGDVGGVLCPEQQVEGRRVVTEQIVVDGRQPDALVGSYPREHRRG